jgi:hypothetical protein
LWPSLLLTIRRRPVGNALLLAGVAVAALGSALTGLGVDGTAASFAVAVALLYADSRRSPSWAYLRVAWIRLTRQRVGR